MTKQKRTPTDLKAFRTMLLRLQRIRKATTSERLRRRAVQSLVLPIITWTGAWTRPTLAKLRSLRLEIERTVIGHVYPGRSNFLTWTAKLGAQLDPEFLLDFRAVQHEVWRLRRRTTQPPLACGRMAEVATRWGWPKVDFGLYDTSFPPPCSPLKGNIITLKGLTLILLIFYNNMF
jgi:hypothetical protein